VCLAIGREEKGRRGRRKYCLQVRKALNHKVAILQGYLKRRMGEKDHRRGPVTQFFYSN